MAGHLRYLAQSTDAMGERGAAMCNAGLLPAILDIKCEFWQEYTVRMNWGRRQHASCIEIEKPQQDEAATTSARMLVGTCCCIADADKL